MLLNSKNQKTFRPVSYVNGTDVLYLSIRCALDMLNFALDTCYLVVAY